MKCPQCQKPLKDGTQVCTACGCRISENSGKTKNAAKGKYTRPKKRSPLHTLGLVLVAVLPALFLVFLLLHGRPAATQPEELKPTEANLPVETVGEVPADPPTEQPTELPADPSTEPAPTEMAKQGYVCEDCAELNIRKGPSTSFAKLGLLKALDPGLVTEITTDGEREWGRIELGWVSLEYIEWGQPPVSAYEVVKEQYQDTAPGTGIDSFGPYVNENVPWAYEYDHINYAEIDLNEDGIKEFVVAARENNGSPVILDLFTLSNGKPVHVVQNMGYGANLRIYEDGSFGISASGDTGYNTIEFFKLPQNSTEPRLIRGVAIEKGDYYYYGETGEKKPGTVNKFAEFAADWDNAQMKIKWIKMK